MNGPMALFTFGSEMRSLAPGWPLPTWVVHNNKPETGQPYLRENGVGVWPMLFRFWGGATAATQIRIHLPLRITFVEDLDILIVKPDPDVGRTRVGVAMQYCFQTNLHGPRDIDLTIDSAADDNPMPQSFPSDDPINGTWGPAVYRTEGGPGQPSRTSFFFDTFAPWTRDFTPPPYPEGLGDLLGANVNGLWLMLIAVDSSDAVPLQEITLEVT